MKIDTITFKWTSWVGVFSSYFLVFLMVWIVICNPPFNDFASPEIRDVQVSWDGVQWVNVTATGTGSYAVHSPENVTANAALWVRAEVTDNVQLDVNTVMISKGGPDQVLMSGTTSPYIFEFEFTSWSDFDLITLYASDSKGQSSTYKFDILP